MAPHCVTVSSPRGQLHNVVTVLCSSIGFGFFQCQMQSKRATSL